MKIKKKPTNLYTGFFLSRKVFLICHTYYNYSDLLLLTGYRSNKNKI